MIVKETFIKPKIYPKVYLAGPISGCTYDGCTDWRELFSKWTEEGIEVLSPMRGKDWLCYTESIGDSYESTVTASQKGITTRDRWDVMRADVIVVNLLGAEKVSIGTMIELGWADSRRIPIITIMEKSGNIHDHCMVREVSGYRVESVEEAVDLVHYLFRG